VARSPSPRARRRRSLSSTSISSIGRVALVTVIAQTLVASICAGQAHRCHRARPRIVDGRCLDAETAGKHSREAGLAYRKLSERTQRGLAILAGATAIGIAADGLLRVGPWGINFALLAGLMPLVLFGISRWQRVPLSRSGAALAVPAVIFGLAFAWRDSAVLQM